MSRLDEGAITDADPLAWHDLFTVMSLDVVEPFLGDMGLRVSSPDELRTCARLFIQERGQPGVDEDDLVHQTLQNIASKCGAQVASDIRGLVEPLSAGSGPGAQARLQWKPLLELIAGLRREPMSVLLPMSAEKIEALRTIVRRHRVDSQRLDARISQAERAPRSDWDTSLYLEYQWDEVTVDKYSPSPLDYVVNAIYERQFRAMWREIRATLSEEEMSSLLKWARNQAEALGRPMPVELPG